MKGTEKQARGGDELYGNAPERQSWQAYVEKEEERRRQANEELVSDHRYAEEYAARAMRGIDATENEYQQAETRGEHHGTGQVSEDLANATDLSGG